MRRLKYTEVAKVRNTLAKQQGEECPICGGSFLEAKLVGKKLVPKLVKSLDHSHVTGVVRGVLCRGCNTGEGRVLNRANRAKQDLEASEWLGNLLEYWNYHNTPRTPYIHPNHKNTDQKRLLRNKRARQKRAAVKAAKLLRKNNG